MEIKDGDNSAKVSTARRIRWWPAIAIVVLAAGALVWVWGWYGVSRQQRNIATAITLICTGALLLVWLLAFSRARWTVRGWVALSVVAVVGLSAALFRIRGVTGDLIPILDWRWHSDARHAVEIRPAPSGSRIVSASTNDYPQFLGPNRTGIVSGPRLARDWKTRPPEELWRRPVGAAWSGFAVAGDFAITQEQHGEDESVVCYQLRTGTPLWSHTDRAHYRTTIAGEGPRATPTIVSNRVYSVGGTGILNCLELATGRRVWSKDIIQDNHSHVNEWGVSCSPLVVNDFVIVSAGGKSGHSLVAYRRETGERVWSGGDEGAGYSSPVLATLAEVRQVLIFNSGGVAAHALDSGQVLWSHPWPRGHPHVTQPVVFPGDRVLIASGYGTGSEMIQITHNGNWTAQRVWKSIRLKPKFTNVIPLDGFIYGLDDGVMVCLEASNGELKWKEGRYGHGQVILAGKLLLVLAENGSVVLLEPVPEEHRELARWAVFKDKTWNSPALAGEFLLVRNDKAAACYRLPVMP